ncbi:N-acetylglucosamine-1-phosphodiester alpha-N-acetylglucosaminidase-like [Glandiceps talaboti]
MTFCLERIYVRVLCLMVFVTISKSEENNRLNGRYVFADDVLTPYRPGHHGPRRSHRFVRDCQEYKYGNKTHEVFPVHNRNESEPLIEVRYFIDTITADIGGVKDIMGHHVTLNDPMKLSVLEPNVQGGCERNERETVVESGKQKKCIMGLNAGFFDTSTGACLGNVISDDRLVIDSQGIQNANFGIKENGKMLFGYLSQEEVIDSKTPFRQLVAGVIWLLRDGEVYINQSKYIECEDTQTTGDMDEFVNVVAGRTAVGHDREGRIILVQVDGQTNVRGVSLWEFATFLQKLGVVNAINLDGGGSSTTVVNETVVGYTTDYCQPGSVFRCARKVSTMLCVYDDEEEADCTSTAHASKRTYQVTGVLVVTMFWRLCVGI